MKRIDTPFAVGGRFVPGNPLTSQKATRIGADWLNMMQEEVANAIELSGIALNGNEQDQLYQAILAIAAGAAGAGGGSVPTTRTVTGTGLITGGGDLVANRVFDVAKASAAEVLAGTVDTKAVTPLSLASAFARSLGTSGYITLPFGGGMMLQWLNGTVPANSSGASFSWPTSFPTACWGAVVNGGRAAFDSSDNPPFANGWGTATVSVFNDVNATTAVFIIGLGN